MVMYTQVVDAPSICRYDISVEKRTILILKKLYYNGIYILHTTLHYYIQTMYYIHSTYYILHSNLLNIA